MMRYCLVKVGMTTDGKVTGLFSAKQRSGYYDKAIWTPMLSDPGVIWYDSPEEANQYLVSANQCIIAISIEDIETELDEPRKIEDIEAEEAAEETNIPLPPHGKGSKYDLLLMDFLDSGEKTRAVKENFGVTHTTVVRGLKRYADLFNYPVKVVDRNGMIYLSRRPKQKAVPEKRRFSGVCVFQ